MAKQRRMCTNEAEYARVLGLERKALRAIVGRLLEAHLPYETVRSVCYEAMRDLVVSPSAMPQHKPGIDFLVGEALEHMETLIDDIVVQRSGDAKR